MTFETERLLLRPWTEADAQQLFLYASDPEVGPAAGWPPHTSVENSRQVIRDVLSEDGTFAVCLKSAGNAPVGSIGYFKRGNISEGVEIGYWIGRPFWGQGLVPEAVRCLLDYLFTVGGVSRVWCAHFIGNDKSRRVIEKCGFRPEFYRSCAWPAIGRTLTEKYYSLRRAEYLTKRSR